MTFFHVFAIVCALFASLIARSARPTPADLAAIPQPPGALEFYAAHPDFFVFKTPQDLPADLVWKNGLEQKPFTSPHARPGGTLRSFIPAYPDTLRTVGPNSNSSFRQYHYDNNLISLVHYHPNTRAHIPGLATEWAVSEDGRTVYFRLDPDARFTDGQPVSVDDFFFLFYFMRTEYIVAPWYNDWYAKEYERITKYDDYTLSITIPLPKPDPIYFASVSPKPRTFYKDFGTDFTTRYDWIFEPKTGPYEILEKDIDKNRFIAIQKSKHWWGAEKPFFKGQYNVDRIEFTVIRDMDKAFEIFLKGEIDMFGLSLPIYWYDKSDSAPFHNGYIHKVLFYNDIPRPTWGLYLNSAKGWLSDINVRIGIQHATDWQRVINGFFRGDFDRKQTYNQGYGRFTNPRVRARPYDPDLAAEAFARAGFTRRGRDGILRNEQGDRLSFKLTMGQGEMEPIMPPLVDSARRAGLEIIPEVLDGATRYRKVMEKNHDIAFWAWGVTGFYPRYWEGFHKVNALDEQGNRKPQTNNITLTADDKMSELIDIYRNSTDEDEMERLSHILQEMIHDDASFVPGYVQNWFRIGHWRWLRFPDEFDVRSSATPIETQLFWIDEDLRRETEQAMRENRKFPPVVSEYTTWRLD